MFVKPAAAIGRRVNGIATPDVPKFTGSGSSVPAGARESIAPVMHYLGAAFGAGAGTDEENPLQGGLRARMSMQPDCRCSDGGLYNNASRAGLRPPGCR